MPTNKDLKRVVRTRMAKTGESYTSARAQVVRANPPKETWPELAGMSDQAVTNKTGKNWVQWVETLDGMGSKTKSHKDIAKSVLDTFPDVGAWWAQGITVGYERIRGLRELGQPSNSKLFTANKSRTFGVNISKLYRSFRNKRQRSKWLDHEPQAIRTATVDKSMRITWDEATSVHLYFVDKGPEKASVAIQHIGHPTKKAADRAKKYWHEQLDRLADALA